MSKQTDLANITDAITVDASANVGIGTSSPSTTLHLAVDSGVGSPTLTLERVDASVSSTNTIGNIVFNAGEDGTEDTVAQISAIAEEAFTATSSATGMLFKTTPTGSTSSTERMRIDASGNLLVGRTSTSDTAVGAMLRPDGFLQTTRDGNIAADFNRNTSDGDIVRFSKGSSPVGSIGSQGTSLYIQANGDRAGLTFGGADVVPRKNNANSDNAVNLGHASYRFDDIFATNGTIQTSDATEKQDIATLTATEMLVGKRLSGLFKTFRWIDSVAENGANARTHTGTIAQDVQAAFTAEGLDAGDYALFISTTWFVDSEGNEVEEGTEGAVSKTRMGIRYPELLSFVAAYNEQRFASIEARLTALEA